jgi:hypothetical protein
VEPIEFNLTQAIVVRASQLHGKKYVVRFLGMSVVAAMMVSAYFLITSNDFSIEQMLVQVLTTLFGALLIAGSVAAFLHFWIQPFYARRNFRQQKILTHTMSIAWTKVGFVFASGNSRTDMAFADLFGYRASDDLLLLFLSAELYYVVPLGSLGDEAIAHDLLTTLDAAGVKRL